MSVCPVCYSDNAQDTTCCSGCGVQLSFVNEPFVFFDQAGGNEGNGTSCYKCPVCRTENLDEEKSCACCGVNLSLAADAAHNSLISNTSPFSATPYRGVPDDSKPLRCKSCGSESKSNERLCASCFLPLFPVRFPENKIRNRVILLIIVSICALITIVTSYFFFSKIADLITQSFMPEALYIYNTPESLPEADYVEASYDDYIVKPQGVYGDYIKITGTVTQIETEYETREDFLTILVAQDHNNRKKWRIGYHIKNNEHIEVGDIITFYGESNGTTKYRTKSTGELFDLPVIRAAAYMNHDMMSGKFWSVEGMLNIDLRDDGTCALVFGPGEEGEITDSGTYKVYQGWYALNYVADELIELGLTEDELIASFDLQEDSIESFYCLLLFRDADKDRHKDDNSTDKPSLFYFGAYSEETGKPAMLSSTFFSFVTLTEVSD